ncbi:MAG: TIGR04211 family SH3 domain-containing protein [Deltaproteobacteria bacterium]|nr:MAG: TIGR04211 family SH3 domain-containing protein [Deltaproteobacteria bacterium]
MLKVLKICAFITITMTLSALAYADTIYIRDLVLVNLREAPQENAPSIRLLRTGDSLELLEAGQVFQKVRTENGEVGWVPTQYTVSEAPAAFRLARVERELSSAKAALAEAKQGEAEAIEALKSARERMERELSDSDKGFSEARKRAKQLEGELASVKEKYNSLLKKSGNVVGISDERDSLAEENAALSEENATLTERTDELEKMESIKWFLAGALVFIIGWILGLSGAKKRKKSQLF